MKKMLNVIRDLEPFLLFELYSSSSLFIMLYLQERFVKRRERLLGPNLSTLKVKIVLIPMSGSLVL